MTALMGIVGIFISVSCGSAFIVPPAAVHLRIHRAQPTTAAGMGASSPMRTCDRRRMGGSTACFMAVEELDQVVDFVTARKLEVVDEAAELAKFEFSIVAQGSMTQSLNHRITRMIKEKANYPGFRPGTIPRQMMKEVNTFVVQEIMNEGISIALNAHGLQGAEGEGTEAEIQTDMEELLKVFKPGKELEFKCEIMAVPKQDDGEEEGEEAASGGVIDV